MTPENRMAENRFRGSESRLRPENDVREQTSYRKSAVGGSRETEDYDIVERRGGCACCHRHTG